MTADAADYRQFTDLRVRFAETDAQGVVYHANFLVYCEVARADWFRALGAAAGEAEHDWRRPREFDVVVAHAACDYRASARFDDLLRVWVRLAAVGRSSFTFAHRIVRADGVLVCEAKTVQVAIGRSDGRPIALPDWFADRLRAFESGQAVSGGSRTG